LVLRAAEGGAVALGVARILRAGLLFAGQSQVDDFGHGYFLRKASSDTTSAPLAGAASPSSDFSASACFFAGAFFSVASVTGSSAAASGSASASSALTSNSSSKF